MKKNKEENIKANEIIFQKNDIDKYINQVYDEKFNKEIDQIKSIVNELIKIINEDIVATVSNFIEKTDYKIKSSIMNNNDYLKADLIKHVQEKNQKLVSEVNQIIIKSENRWRNKLRTEIVELEKKYDQIIKTLEEQIKDLSNIVNKK